MKAVVILITLFAAITTAHGQMAIMEIEEDIQECLSHSGLTIEEIAKVMVAKDEVWERPEAQEIMMKAGCFLACTLQQDGEMEGSKLLVSQMHKNLDKLQKSVDICADRVKTMTDECNVALAFTTCLMDYM